jgi:hypothetical protein
VGHQLFYQVEALQQVHNVKLFCLWLYVWLVMKDLTEVVVLEGNLLLFAEFDEFNKEFHEIVQSLIICILTLESKDLA